MYVNVPSVALITRVHNVLAEAAAGAVNAIVDLLDEPDANFTVTLTVSDAAASPEVPAATAGASSTSVVQRGVAPPGPRVELSITDDGPGISAELLPELFERFTRGEAGRARDAGAAGKSTGLGLAIVDAVVAAHGGAIVVTSHPGMTRFAILLPLLHEPAGQPQAAPF